MTTRAEGTVRVAHYSYDGHSWVVQFDDPDVSTYGRTLEKAMTAAREALAVTLGYPSVNELLAQVEIEDRVHTGTVDDGELLDLRRDRDLIEKQLDAVASRTARLAKRLVKAGLSYRDAATAVGLSHQRISQLVRKST